MEFKLQMIISNHGQSQQAIDLTPLSRTTNNMIDLGLSLADSNHILKSIQEIMVNEQIRDYLANQQCCPDCHLAYRIKDHKTKKLNTLFGNLSLKSPRFYTCQ